MKNFFKRHKAIYITAIIIFFTLILIVAIAVLYYFKYSATSKAVRYGAKGYITKEEYYDIKKAGSFILGEEFYDEYGNSYDLEIDEQGVLLARTIKNNSGDPIHIHRWVAHRDNSNNIDFCYCSECLTQEQVDTLATEYESGSKAM